jgi:hypothetical protein
MTAPHAVLKKFPPLGKPKSPGRAAVEIRDLAKHFGPATTVRAQGEIAGHEQLAVLGLAPRTRSLEEAFIALTGVQS